MTLNVSNCTRLCNWQSKSVLKESWPILLFPFTSSIASCKECSKHNVQMKGNAMSAIEYVSIGRNAIIWHTRVLVQCHIFRVSTLQKLSFKEVAPWFPEVHHPRQSKTAGNKAISKGWPIRTVPNWTSSVPIDISSSSLLAVAEKWTADHAHGGRVLIGKCACTYVSVDACSTAKTSG